MILIIGGAFQGKKNYAEEHYEIRGEWVEGTLCSWDDLFSCGGVDHFHELIRSMVQTGAFFEDSLIDLEQKAAVLADQLLKENPDIVIITNELGYGVVPVEKEDRFWREAVGRLCTELASRSEEVVRVVCGIGMRLK